ncbi:MAG: HD domain-containing protein [Saprospiraceae bacterium]|nr:HD domain-containing protein [Saprospiraceae bacterium]
MLFQVDPSERRIFDLLAEAGKDLNVPVYIIGGYVRDKMLGIPCKDLDIVCEGSGIALANEVASRLDPQPNVTIYKRFGTAMLRHGDVEMEFVGARKESYRSHSRKPIVEDGTIRDDQLRRDFTVNALSVSLNEHNFGQIIDPFNGLQDLRDKVLRTPLEPGKTFSDDPLRMMRGIRFSAQLGFTLSENTLDAIPRNKERIKIVSMERITGELEKILRTPKPSTGFKLLFDTGLLEIIFPEMVRLHGVEKRNGISHKDNFYHTLQVVDNLARKTDNVWTRWAALLHDIGKPPTKRFDSENGWTFYGHDAVGAAMVPQIFKRLKLPLDHKMKYVQKLVRLHLRPISLTREEITDSAIRRLLYEAGDDIDDLMLLCEADITSKNPKRVKRYLENYEIVREKMIEVEEKDHLRNWEPPIDGQIIMETFDLKPGPVIGDIKTAIREAILDGKIANDYDEAYAYMKKVAGEMGISNDLQQEE